MLTYSSLHNFKRLVISGVVSLQETTDLIHRYDPPVQPEDLYAGACKCFQQARICYEKILNPDEQVGKYVCKGFSAVFYIEPVRRPQADNFQPGLATLLLAGPAGRQLFV